MTNKPVELVPVRSTRPTVAQQRLEACIKESERPAAGVNGHFNPTAQQYNALLRQTRRKSVVPKDELWGVLHQMHPDFVTNPPSLMSATPVMDSGVSTALILQHNMERKKALREFDRSRETPSAAFAIEEVQKLVAGEGGPKGVPCGKERFVTTSHASQTKVLTSAAAVAAMTTPHAAGGSTIGRRLMPERAVTTLHFGHSALELDLIARQSASVAGKTTQFRPWSRSQQMPGDDRITTPLRYATRSATSLGDGLHPNHATVPLDASQSAHPVRRAATPLIVTAHPHNLTRSMFDQEAVLCRRERELEFSRVRRLPRPSNQLKTDTEVFSLR